MTGACGVVDGEDVYCRTHLAERLNLPKHKVDYLVHVRVFGPFPGTSGVRKNCTLRWRGNTLIKLGEIMDYEATRG